MLGAVLACGSAWAQQPESAAPKSNQLRLTVTVDGRNGKPVDDLTEADFKLLDNKKVQPITSFRAVDGADVPTEMILVIDAINMPYSRLAYARQQIDQFLSANGGELPQPTAIAIVMDTNSQVMPGFSKDGNTLRRTLDNYSIGLRNITRSAGFYGASERFNISVNALRILVSREMQKPGLKRIVWISPGWPLLSGPEVNLTSSQRQTIFANAVALSTEMRQARIMLDAVNPLGTESDVGRLVYYQNFVKGIRSPNDAQIADLGLQVIAEQSGGLVLDASNDIAGLLTRSFAQTKAFYEIGFEAAPGEHDNEYHQVQVQVAKPGLVAHTTQGYYARPTFTGAARDVNPTHF